MTNRFLASAIVLTGCFWAASVLDAGLAAQQRGAATAMARLTGTVTSSSPFKAAQVYIRNVDRKITYMVFTSAGQFRAVSLFPGNYEISVKTTGLESDVQKVALAAGDNTRVNL